MCFQDEDGIFGEFEPLVMDTGPSQDDEESPAAENIRSMSPSRIRLHSEQPQSSRLPRPEPVKANPLASLSIPGLGDNRTFPNLASVFTGVSASPVISATSSLSGNSENSSPATTPLSTTDDASKLNGEVSSAASVMRRGSKVTRVM